MLTWCSTRYFNPDSCGTCDCASGGCGDCECADCGGDGEGMAIIAIVVLAIIAIIGAFVTIYYIYKGIKGSVNTHLSIIQRGQCRTTLSHHITAHHTPPSYREAARGP